MAKVLVTGAAGLVGAEVTARLAASGHEVLALVHRATALVRNDGTAVTGAVSPVRGDVTRVRFGLSEADWTALRSSADLVVHCAAITDFGRQARRYEDVNVTGTAHALELGVPMVHVSTAYVCGERHGVIAEHELETGQRFANAYEDSKFRAEQLVRKARADGVRVAVVRPSIVTGASRTGVVRDFKNLYVVLKLAVEGKVNSIPGHYDACLDLVPVDYVAAVVTEAVNRFDEAAGRTFHAVGGPMALREVSDVLAEYPSCRVPRFVPPSTFTAGGLPAAERIYHERIVSLYGSYFQRKIRFDDSETVAFLPRHRRATGAAYLRRVLDHCFAAGYLGTPLPGVAEVLAGAR
ncbi:SDR family oxidoreductase [Amycolatopsis minnesotensis]|uniref:Thioester reductase (TE) domain-containing protein n=1 Tax=Amycolatopsis minnesotensis TaxID=337894 RepID=A0ABN2QSV7_9PSEU